MAGATGRQVTPTGSDLYPSSLVEGFNSGRPSLFPLVDGLSIVAHFVPHHPMHHVSAHFVSAHLVSHLPAHLVSHFTMHHVMTHFAIALKILSGRRDNSHSRRTQSSNRGDDNNYGFFHFRLQQE